METDTEIRNLSSGEYRDFLEENHLQGAVNSKTKVGLFHNDTLVSAIGLSTRSGYTTIDRFVSKAGTRVVGGFSRLIKHSDVTGVVRTHSANRYASGNLYASQGFSLISETRYTLGYTDGRRYLPRQRFQKHKLASIYPEYNGEPVHEFLKEKNIFPYYGAGVKTWEKTYLPQ